MRRPRNSISSIPGHSVVGTRIRTLLDTFVKEYPEALEMALDAVERNIKDGGPDDEILDTLRKRLAEELKASSIHGTDDGTYFTTVRHDLLRAWVRESGDPDTAVADWFVSGAPAGIELAHDDCGIFPKTADQNTLDDNAEARQESIDSTWNEDFDYDSLYNYTSVEDDPDAKDEMDRMINSGQVKTFTNLEDAKVWLNGRLPIISKMAMVKKVKEDGTFKCRIIWDCRRGPHGDDDGVNSHTIQMQRIILPRGSDAAEDAMALRLQCDRSEKVEFFVLDFADAFPHVPLAHQERRYFSTKYKGMIIISLTIAQGSRNAPLSWGRVAALLGRISQSLFLEDELRLSIYTDDPIAVVKGRRSSRNHFIGILVLLWRALGLRLAFHKAARGSEVVWVGYRLKVSTEQVVISVKDELLQEIKQMIQKLTKNNIVALKDLESFAGKCNHVAGMLYTWRPFLREIWGAISWCRGQTRHDYQNKLPNRCVWVKQFIGPVRWITAFLDQQTGTLERVLLVDAFRDSDSKVRITTDASPWGLGGFIEVQGKIVSFFADAISTHDVEIFNVSAGTCEGQQVWEALAILQALRVWKHFWRTTRARLEVRADNVAALTLVMKMKAKGDGMNLIARELALDIGSAAFRPNVVAHTPGIANVTADQLSRKFMPDVVFTLPKALDNVEEVHLPLRTKEFYKSLAPLAPAASGSHGQVTMAARRRVTLKPSKRVVLSRGSEKS